MNTYQSLSSLELKISPEELDLLPKSDSYFLELLFRNISGLSTNKKMFNEQNLSIKLGIEISIIKERIRELERKGYLEYINGALSSVKFLQHRDERAISGKYWNLFLQIQKNKIQKWEEMKFFVENKDFCKMKMILSYFGEKEVKNCGICSVCEKQKEQVFGRDIGKEILSVLQKNPANVEEISLHLNYYEKETILENLIYLLDSGEVKMLNFRTYMLS